MEKDEDLNYYFLRLDELV